MLFMKPESVNGQNTSTTKLITDGLSIANYSLIILYYNSAMSYIAYQMRLYHVRRKVAVALAFFGTMWFGYTFSGWGKNLYTLGYC